MKKLATDYSWVTDEMFQEKLAEFVSGYDVLSVPGIYEILSEYFNDEVLEALEDERDQ